MEEKQDFSFRIESGESYKSRNLVYEEPDYRLVIYLEMSGVKQFDWVACNVEFLKWTIPKGVTISEEKRYEILSRLNEWCKKKKVRIDIGSPIDMNKMFSEYEKKGYKIEKLPDGSTEVIPPQKKNIFIPALLTLGLLTTFLLTKNLFFLYLLGFFLVIIFLSYLALRNPNAFWAKLLFESRGHRTDTKYMTKKGLYDSGAKFLKWSFFIFLILFSLGIIINNRNKIESSMVLLVLFFIILFLFLISLSAGLYLFFRGWLKRNKGIEH